MATRQKVTTDDVLELLSPERRQEILVEAMGARVRGMLLRGRGATLGNLVEGLRKDPHWSMLQALPVGDVLGDNVIRPRARLTEDVLERIVEVVKTSPGLRSEQIQAELDLPRPLVKAGLSKLRVTKRVKTTGHRRSTTYRSA